MDGKAYTEADVERARLALRTCLHAFGERFKAELDGHLAVLEAAALQGAKVRSAFEAAAILASAERTLCTLCRTETPRRLASTSEARAAHRHGESCLLSTPLPEDEAAEHARLDRLSVPNVGRCQATNKRESLSLAERRELLTKMQRETQDAGGYPELRAAPAPKRSCNLHADCDTETGPCCNDASCPDHQ